MMRRRLTGQGSDVAGISITKSLDQLLIRPSATVDDVANACELAGDRHLAAVVVYPVHVRLAAGILDASDTRVCAAIGFPYGQETTQSKLVSIDQAQSDGADEMAVMLHHAGLAAGRLRAAVSELQHVLAQTAFGSLTSSRGTGNLTVVIESMMYDLGRMQPLWDALDNPAIGFLQTSSGLQQRTVTAEHLHELRRVLPEHVSIRATGNVHLAGAEELLAAGATRVCSDVAVTIADEERIARDYR